MTPPHPRTPAAAATPGPRTAAGQALLDILFTTTDSVTSKLHMIACVTDVEAEARDALMQKVYGPRGMMESCTKWHRGGVEHYHYKPLAASDAGSVGALDE